jgi:hypothetical protein
MGQGSVLRSWRLTHAASGPGLANHGPPHSPLRCQKPREMRSNAGNPSSDVERSPRSAQLMRSRGPPARDGRAGAMRANSQARSQFSSQIKVLALTPLGEAAASCCRGDRSSRRRSAPRYDDHVLSVRRPCEDPRSHYGLWPLASGRCSKCPRASLDRATLSSHRHTPRHSLDGVIYLWA